MDNECQRLKLEFKLEVNALRDWIDSLSAEKATSSEWVAWFDDWPRITKAFSDLLDSCGLDALDNDDIERSLYALARDGETEVLKQELEKRPLHLFNFALYGLKSGEREARWQLADALGKVPPKGSVDDVLEKYFYDHDEYVSRRALLALGRRKSEKTDILAQKAWDTENEYQQMAALDALRICGSPRFQTLLQQARASGKARLSTFAERLLAHQPD